MNKLGFLILIICLFMFVGIASADDYTLTLTTHTPTAGDADFANGAYPNIAGGARIDKLVFSNSGATAHTVTIYDLCNSTLTAVSAATVVIPAAAGVTTIDYPFHNPLLLTNMGMKTSATATTVNVNVQYR